MQFTVIISLILIVLFFIFGWALKKKKAYFLISGFASKPESEQKRLIELGYPDKVGTMFIVAAVGMLLLLPIAFTSFPFALEVILGYMLIVLVGGMVIFSKYETPEKRKKRYIINSTFAIVTISFVITLYIIGYKDFDIEFGENTFHITGLYGDEWSYEEIEEVKLLEEWPNIKWRKNGFGLPTMSKGHFSVDGYGSSLLFLHHRYTPILYIQTTDDTILINSKNEERTVEWYEKLQSNDS